MTPKTINGKGRIPTSIKINQDLWKQAKIEAINRNVDLSELVEKAVRKEIGIDEVELARYSLKQKRKRLENDF